MKKTEFDKKESYCRKLGHHVAFKYCRLENEKLPCRKILDCWFVKFPVQDYIQEYFSKEEVSYIFKVPKPKIASILDIVNQIKKNE